MAHELSELIVSLKDVRKYLIKIGPSRRTGNIIQIKLQEVDSLCTQYSKILEKIEDIKGSIKEDEYLFIKKTCEQFDSLHKEILNLCSVQTKQLSNMAKFDLKVAINLLPVSSDDEDSIKRLIDGIDYYSSELDDESQRRLVNFVLKNRLSQAAKLKLCSTYGSVSALLCDMKNQLLPKKSTTSIQRKLYNFRQNDLSIDEFGKQVTELFVDLTITQSEGKEDVFKILKPINEKQAIKSFAEGLRNRRLSTLISARNYTSLKDAVQAAVDEETSSPSTSGDVMYINRYNAYNNNFRSYGYRHGRAPRRGMPSTAAGRGPPEQSNTDSGQRWSTGRGWRGQRGSGTASRAATKTYFRTRGRGNSNDSHIHTLTTTESDNIADLETDNQFFRD